jgi:hypothetical protein
MIAVRYARKPTYVALARIVSALAAFFFGAGLAAAQSASPEPGKLWWSSAESLLWWTKDARVPTPLVVTGPVVGNMQPVLGQPGFQTVLGGSDVAMGLNYGGRFTLGRWLGPARTLGVEGSFFFLGDSSKSQSVQSSGAPGSPFLALPFFDPTIPGESSTRISSPGAFAGTATLTTTARLRGGELNLVSGNNVIKSFGYQPLVGLRFLSLKEDLIFDTNSPSVVPPLDVFQTRDQFTTSNQFYGAQAGLRAEARHGIWFVQGTGKLALGVMHQTVDISSALVTNDFNGIGAPQVFPGGYFAQPTNIGHQSRDRFAAIPEVNLNVGVKLAGGLRARVGYTFLYVSDVVRPGDQMDRRINPSQAPAITGVPSTTVIGPANPAPLFRSTSFWAQGITMGLELPF